MPDKFTEVTQKSWGSNITDSIKGVVVGLIMFVLSFVVLWVNEGRQDMSVAAKLCQPIKADSVQTDMEGQPVSVSAKLISSEKIGDPEYIVPGDYISLTRNVEMFAWVENQTSESKDKIGGGTETVTTYTYEMKWTSSPAESSSFRYPEGHQNSVLTISGKTYKVSSAKVGAYELNMDSISLPGENIIELKSDMLITGVANIQGQGQPIPQPQPMLVQMGITQPTVKRLEAGYIFIGKGSIQSPVIGDVRINFSALKSNIYVTVFGKLQGERIIPFMYEGEHKLYRAFTAEREEAIAQLHTEFKVMGWIIRAIGFLMMWIGLTMFFGPINAVLNVLPILGSVGRGIVSFVMFFVALVLSIVTVVVSIIAHNTVVLLITLAIIIGVVVYWIMKAKKK